MQARVKSREGKKGRKRKAMISKAAGKQGGGDGDGDGQERGGLEGWQ